MKQNDGINWKQHFKDQQVSGLSVQEYLKVHKLAESRWYKWRQRLFGKARSKTAAAFVPVVFDNREKMSNVSIQIDGGIKISFSEEVNLARLSNVIRALRSA